VYVAEAGTGGREKCFGKGPDAVCVGRSGAVGPVGALYVGELTARPFVPDIARVWRVVPGRAPTVYARGFTNISDMAFEGANLLVLELADKGLYDPRSTGALRRVRPDGTSTLVAKAGLVMPTGLAVTDGSVYISNYGVFPGSGAGPPGQVLKLDLQ
jgi:hypothetical protein